jgi:hypothetical protein
MRNRWGVSNPVVPGATNGLNLRQINNKIRPNGTNISYKCIDRARIAQGNKTRLQNIDEIA